MFEMEISWHEQFLKIVKKISLNDTFEN